MAEEKPTRPPLSFLGVMSALQRNRVFKFTSSVKLAVPLMVVLICVVATGTVLESMYTSDYAKLAIYQSWWFLSLLGLLFLNILNAALSRIPWKRRHTGFVITHLGLLTLLTGAMMTSLLGIDGQLPIMTGSDNSMLILPRLQVSYQFEDSPVAQSVTFEKSLNTLQGNSLQFINGEFGHLFTVQQILPFAAIEKTYDAPSDHPDDVAVSFIMRNQFFNMTDWLHSRDNPEQQMGPAVLRLVIDTGKTVKSPKKQTSIEPPKTEHRAPTAAKTASTLEIKDAETRKVLKSVSVKDLASKPVKVGKYTITLKKKFANGVVVQNKMVENPEGGSANPVLEIEIKPDSGEAVRDIVYAKFPDFSLQKAPLLLFTYTETGIATESLGGDSKASHGMADGQDTEAKDSAPPALSGKPSKATGPREKNTIEFHLNKENPKLVRVELYKENKMVGESALKEGQSFETPWMGITVFVGTVAWGKAASIKALPIAPERGKELPPSAALVRLNGADAEPFWLIEGDAKVVPLDGKLAQVYFGRENLHLPFSVHLDEFRKKDYPGTEMPMSYESTVRVNGGEPEIISMNEPIKRDGFTLYQASYVLEQGRPPETILSVNRDPGRPVKYIGSLILAFGIILFTLMRSQWYTRRFT